MNRIFNFGKNKKEEERALMFPALKAFGIDTLMDDFFGDMFTGFGFLKTSKIPAVDVYERDNKVIVKAELPGIDKKDIRVNLEEDILTISGELKEEREEKEKGRYYSERYFGKIQRSIRLPEGVKLEDIRATYKNGVLNVEIPKGESEKKRKEISIE